MYYHKRKGLKPRISTKMNWPMYRATFRFSYGQYDLGWWYCPFLVILKQDADVLSNVFLSVSYVYTLGGWYWWKFSATEVVDVAGRGGAGGCDILNVCHVGRVPCDAVVATAKKGVFKVVEVGVDGTAVVSVECFGIVRTYCAIIVSSGAKVLCSSSFYISQTTVKYRIQSG